MKLFLIILWLAVAVLQDNIFAEITEFDNFLNPNAARVSGFINPQVIQAHIDAIANPIRRSAQQRLFRSEQRAASDWAEFERMANIARMAELYDMARALRRAMVSKG